MEARSSWRFRDPCWRRGGYSCATAAETLFGLLLALGWNTRIVALLSGALLTTFALTMTVALGVKAPLNLSVFSAAGGALLLGVRADFPFSVDEVLRRNRQEKDPDASLKL
jgi:uncharacterized membrane protein YphA (DoxX/SURF4 family)